VQYNKDLFDPDHVALPATVPARAEGSLDRRSGAIYVYTDEIVLAVNVALVTGRPLLVSGAPGSGKSTLAVNVAAVKGWPYHELEITPTTKARDLLWSFDAVRRLRDAQAGELKRPEAYIAPGVLWQAFEEPEQAVVLLDEIDKSDPDVPNGLLAALGDLKFKVDELGGRPVSAVHSRAPFVVLTTNDERQLPRPFVRRCVTLSLRAPNRRRLVEIAIAHKLDKGDDLAEMIAGRMSALRQEAKRIGVAPPSTAEYLDALRTCNELEIKPDSDEWKAIVRATLLKDVTPDDGDPDEHEANENAAEAS
jgi:MoxR-like ATPase